LTDCGCDPTGHARFQSAAGADCNDVLHSRDAGQRSSNRIL